MSYPQRVSTGIDALDSILDGGLVRRQNALLRGSPGAGKTIFGLHFLAEGVAQGENSLYVNLGEPTEYVRAVADSFGLAPQEIEFLELAPDQAQFAAEESYSLFASADVETTGYVEQLSTTVEEVDPDRVLLDPITEFRYLAHDEHQFRKQILSLLDFLKTHDATVLLTSQAAETMPDDDLQFMVDGVLNLERSDEGRTIHVSKFRGSSFQRGRHAYEISSDGVSVWPKVLPEKGTADFEFETLSSGVPELDNLLKGGLDNGTVTFFTGPTGVGKTTTGLEFLTEAAGQGRGAVMYSFEESRRTLTRRSKALNIPLESMLEDGRLHFRQISPDELAADEFANMVRTAVEEEGVEVVMLDGVQGFKQNLRATEPDPAADLLRVGRYLRSVGVATIITNEIHNVTGEFRATEDQMSNLADNIVFLRHVEHQGRMRKVIGVLKMRTSDFERNLRELKIGDGGIHLGESLPGMRGILTGTPEWTDTSGSDTNGDEA